mmetsp:Transcript_119707/g.343912  ORF Transcript_119707/g.343912 Transcript_119707/m.343912 type:complete len:220 (+) Transcript_119707:338-997(+)
MIVDLVQEDHIRTIALVRHPAAPPLAEPVALGLHLGVRRQGHGAPEHAANVLSMQTMGHDVRDSGNLATAERDVEVADFGRDELAVQVQPVVVPFEQLFDFRGLEVLLLVAGGADDGVDLDCLTRLGLYAALYEALDRALFALELAAAPLVNERCVQHSRNIVEICDHVKLRVVAPPMPSLDHEDQLHEAESDPHDREQNPGQASVEARRARRVGALVP